MISAVIFDLDNTLADFMIAVSQSPTEFAQSSTVQRTTNTLLHFVIFAISAIFAANSLFLL
jgi:beta-phosphoglucomutase-like phosphatase (HAD superfamily)